MAKGEVFDTPIIRFNDDRTGREVWKVTCWDDCHCAATYMYFQTMTGDDRQLVFASDRTGTYEVYCVDLETEKTTQLSHRDDSEDAPPKNVIRTHLQLGMRDLFFMDGMSVHAVNLDSLDHRVVATPPKDHGYKLYVVNNILTPDGQHLLCRFINDKDESGIALASTDGRNDHRELFTIDDTSLTIAHMTVSPDGSTIAFNIAPDRQNDPDAAHDLRARCWGYHLAEQRIFNLLTMPKGFRATHETWGADNRLYVHRKTVPSWTPTFIDSVAVDGSDRQKHFGSPDRKLGHSCVSPDLKWIVSDVQDTDGNELYLIDRETGESEILCWPDARTLDGVTGHVHPTFSPSSRRIVYTSDKTGKAAVFVVPIA